MIASEDGYSSCAIPVNIHPPPLGDEIFLDGRKFQISANKLRYSANIQLRYSANIQLRYSANKQIYEYPPLPVFVVPEI